MTRYPWTYFGQRFVLLLIGVAIILLGINVGFGGIKTLGWQVPTDFIHIADANAFAQQDNHVRFLGGFWFGAGLVFVFAALKPHGARPILTALIVMIVAGGVARVMSLDATVLLDPSILQSLVLELVGFPLLAVWIHKTPVTGDAIADVMPN